MTRRRPAGASWRCQGCGDEADYVWPTPDQAAQAARAHDAQRHAGTPTATVVPGTLPGPPP